MLGFEMGDVGWCALAGFSAAIDARVDELLYACLGGCVDEGFSLLDFILAGELDGKDAREGFGDGGKDADGVVQIPGDEFDGRRLLSQGNGGAGGWITSYGVDCGAGGSEFGVGEKGTDCAASLLAGGTSDEIRFGHYSFGLG